jgi:hypothetical protein
LLIDLLVSFIVAFTSVRTVIDKTTRLFRLDEVHFVPEIARQIRWMTSRLRLINRSTSFDNYQKPRTEVVQTSERSVCVVVAVVVIEQKKKLFKIHETCILLVDYEVGQFLLRRLDENGPGEKDDERMNVAKDNEISKS